MSFGHHSVEYFMIRITLIVLTTRRWTPFLYLPCPQLAGERVDTKSRGELRVEGLQRGQSDGPVPHICPPEGAEPHCHPPAEEARSVSRMGGKIRGMDGS